MKDLFENINIDEILSFLQEKKWSKNYNLKHKPDQYQTKWPLNTIPNSANVSSKLLTTKM